MINILWDGLLKILG